MVFNQGHTHRFHIFLKMTASRLLDNLPAALASFHPRNSIYISIGYLYRIVLTLVLLGL